MICCHGNTDILKYIIEHNLGGIDSAEVCITKNLIDLFQQACSDPNLDVSQNANMLARTCIYNNRMDMYQFLTRHPRYQFSEDVFQVAVRCDNIELCSQLIQNPTLSFQNLNIGSCDMLDLLLKDQRYNPFPNIPNLLYNSAYHGDVELLRLTLKIPNIDQKLKIIPSRNNSTNINGTVTN